ncbi:hypothetical protein [Burkholderia ubonensis]|uniref:Uncharacterized protein n=1 Tax=Burkholderia ubonensis subsp. mesacidophila TaxID=265293 RepID=A0A2A4FCE0_9BURK|nr:hypothetical protein [Burkholderia ubonensis]PCE30352.1 hypothetical protein BZL54_21920 [Burkholderia ubonensis subsp. mesacidophila]
MANEPIDTFVAWVDSVEMEARRAFGRSDADLTWLIGGIEEMRPSFHDGMSAARYVQAQIETIG